MTQPEGQLTTEHISGLLEKHKFLMLPRVGNFCNALHGFSGIFRTWKVRTDFLHRFSHIFHTKKLNKHKNFHIENEKNQQKISSKIQKYRKRFPDSGKAYCVLKQKVANMRFFGIVFSQKSHFCYFLLQYMIHLP